MLTKPNLAHQRAEEPAVPQQPHQAELKDLTLRLMLKRMAEEGAFPTIAEIPALLEAERARQLQLARAV